MAAEVPSRAHGRGAIRRPRPSEGASPERIRSVPWSSRDESEQPWRWMVLASPAASGRPAPLEGPATGTRPDHPPIPARVVRPLADLARMGPGSARPGLARAGSWGGSTLAPRVSAAARRSGLIPAEVADADLDARDFTARVEKCYQHLLPRNQREAIREAFGTASAPRSEPVLPLVADLSSRGRRGRRPAAPARIRRRQTSDPGKARSTRTSCAGDPGPAPSWPVPRAGALSGQGAGRLDAAGPGEGGPAPGGLGPCEGSSRTRPPRSSRRCSRKPARRDGGATSPERLL